MEQAASFDDEIFEELKTEKGIPLSTILGDRDVTFLYVSSNECAECISDFIDFNDILPDEMPENANFIYLIYGYDKFREIRGKEGTAAAVRPQTRRTRG